MTRDPAHLYLSRRDSLVPEGPVRPGICSFLEGSDCVLAGASGAALQLSCYLLVIEEDV